MKTRVNFPRRSILAIAAASLLASAAGCGRPPDVAQTEPTRALTPAAKPRVLVVLSSATAIPLRDGKEYRTGYFLNELMVPVKALIDAGVEPVFANPKGNTPTMDVHSDDPSFFGGDAKLLAEIRALRDSLPGLSRPRRLADVIAEGLDGYAGVFVPGGHAPMGDLLEDADTGSVLRAFHERGKPTGLICHGPIALLSTTKDPHAFVAALAAGDEARARALAEGFPYAGYRMTSFSTAEEKHMEEIGFLQGLVRFYPDAALRAAGGAVDVGPAFKSHVVRDRELFTAQQPASDAEMVRAFVPAVLESAKRR
jgi:putative intracellular protease/amidase